MLQLWQMALYTRDRTKRFGMTDAMHWQFIEFLVKQRAAKEALR